MSLAQSNFDDARRSAKASLERLASDERLVLSEIHPHKLQALLWDLDMVAATLRLEVGNRLGAEWGDTGT